MTITCAHTNAVPVETGGETVAGLCPDYDQYLPAAWFDCDHDEAVEITELSQRTPQYLCPGCGASYAAAHG